MKTKIESSINESIELRVTKTIDSKDHYIIADYFLYFPYPKEYRLKNIRVTEECLNGNVIFNKNHFDDFTDDELKTYRKYKYWLRPYLSAELKKIS